MAPLAILAAAYVLGILLGAPHQSAPFAVVALVLAMVGWRFPRRIAVLRGPALIAAGLAGGAFRAGELPNAVPRARLIAHTAALSGRVQRGCDVDGDADVCVVQTAVDGRVRVRFPTGGCDALPGDRISAIAAIEPIAPEVNGARWGAGAALVRNGITNRAHAERCTIDRSDPDPVDMVRRLALRLRRALARGIASALAPPVSGEARALLFGDESSIDALELREFRESGLAHILAVSGAHVALIAWILGSIARAIFRRIPAVAVRGLVGPLAIGATIPCVTLFVAVTGESISSVRALCSAVLAGVVGFARRRPHAESLIAGSALLTAGAFPACVLDPGWQLSIVAAWALASRPVAEGDHSTVVPPTLWRSVAASLMETLRASIRVGVAVAPVLAWHFQRVPATALVANTIAAPVAETVALPLVLSVGAMGALVRLPHVVGAVSGELLNAIFAMPRVALALPVASASVPAPSPVQAVTLVLAAVIAMRVGLRGRLAIAALALAVVVPLEIHAERSSHSRGVLRVTAIDVGQGDSVLVDLPDGTAMLVDAGGRPVGFDPGERIVVPFLSDRRRRELVAVIASHPHPDHIGGLRAVLRWASVGELWDTRQGERPPNGGAEYREMRTIAGERGVRVRGPEVLCGPARPFHGALVQVLAPCPGVEPGVPPNDASFVIRISYGRSSVLLPGDLERRGESRVIDRLEPTTVLKVGHHGSRTSSTDAFLDRLRPQIAIVSAGHPSPFEHPNEDVEARFRARGIAWWSTATSGGVSVTLRADGSNSVGALE